MRLLAEKDAQIRMVLEEKFFRPVVSAPAEVRRVPAVDAASLSDQAHDTRKGDEKELAAQDEALKKAQETLESELRALESEQEAAHAAPAEAEATSEAVPA